MNNYLLEAKEVKMYFPIRGGLFRKTKNFILALDDVSLSLKKREIFGLVGESGSGKTTFARILGDLQKPTGGHVIFEGFNIDSLSPKEYTEYRRNVQMIFQNPYESLHPKMTVFDFIYEPLIVQNDGSSPDQKTEKVMQMLEELKISPEVTSSYPRGLSGGQRQRVALARSLITKPKVLLADEPVSMLDASIRGSILNIILDFRERHELTALYITHDLAIARHVCDRVAVMYLGKIVEIAEAGELVHFPVHPYTRGLIAAIPRPDPNSTIRIEIGGEIGSNINTKIPHGCRLYSRCSYAQERCRTVQPELQEVTPGHYVSCHRSDELSPH